MFKSARWRTDKTKFTAVFKLQFHATGVAQLGVDGLMITLAQWNDGKPGVRSDKAKVEDGACRWEDPVYVTVKFTREPKTGKISEIFYNLIVSTGFSNALIIGEVLFDFAIYVDATKACSVSLPLQNSSSNAILNVSIRRLQENVDQREIEECQNAKVKSHQRSLKAHLSSSADPGESISSLSIEDGSLHKTIQNSDLHDNCTGSSSSDFTMSHSESSSSGVNTPRELALNLTSIRDKPTANGSTRNFEVNLQSQWEWSVDSDHGLTTSVSTNTCQDTLQLASDLEIESLKAEVAILARKVDVSELELQTLRRQIVKESKKGQELSREMLSLKVERDALKEECEKLKLFQKRVDTAKVKDKLEFEGGDVLTLLEEIRRELYHERDLNGNLRVQLQKTQEANADLILAVQDLDEMLEEKNKEISDLPNKLGSCEEGEEFGGTMSKCEVDNGDYDDVDQKALEDIVKDHEDSKDTCLLDQKMLNLYSEIEIYHRDKDELEMQMEQLALDYEILKQENHDISYKLEQSQLHEQLKMQYECLYSFDNINDLQTQVRSLENELEKQKEELSVSLATINELEAHITTLEEELEKQEQGFEADLEALTCDKIKQEQRAIQAEESLKMTRSKNANAAERLQGELRKLCKQMACTFDENERVATKAMAEASELQKQKMRLELLLQKAEEEVESVRNDLEATKEYFTKQIDFKANQIEHMLSEINKKSKEIEHQRKQNEEASRTSSQDIAILKAEITKLKAENNFFSEQVKNTESLRAELEQRRNVERNELASKMALLKKEAAISLEQLNCMTLLKDEKDTKVFHLQAEMETLKAQLEEFKNSPLEDELVKDTGKTLLNGHIPEENVNALPLIKSDGGNQDGFLTELTALEEKNERMEYELKEMQGRYSEISLKFAEVEGERQKLVMTVRNLKASRKAYKISSHQQCETK